ncbi:hypothetical protein [Exiguobacterium flavidum]|uniref:hypothetical protein n=1 Tax=Exiguobacterium flavidum TaxID=2184695 RepID=UPI001E620D13|nr:hypothetical protein [Exiguobacterium flavidum]
MDKKVRYRDAQHERRCRALLNRLSVKDRSSKAFQSMIFLATGNSELLRVFSDYFFPESGEFFFRELLEERIEDERIRTLQKLLVQLYNGRTTVTIIEVIDALREEEDWLELTIRAIEVRAFGIDEA